MLARMRIELLEPVVARKVTSKMLNAAIYAGYGINPHIEFEDIEGSLIELEARSFDRNVRERVVALDRGSVEMDVEIDPEAAMRIVSGRSEYRKVCHKTRIKLRTLRSRGLISLYRIPDCGYVNLLLGRKRPDRELRLWRDSRGFRHTFGRARFTITLRTLRDLYSDGVEDAA